MGTEPTMATVYGEQRWYRVAVRGRIIVPGTEFTFRSGDGPVRARFVHAANRPTSLGPVRHLICIDAAGTEHAVTHSQVAIVHRDRQLGGAG